MSILWIHCGSLGLSRNIGICCNLILFIVRIMVSNILSFTVQMYTTSTPSVLQHLLPYVANGVQVKAILSVFKGNEVSFR
jgi:ABC-type arginine/histidine transport system permease subunit